MKKTKVVAKICCVGNGLILSIFIIIIISQQALMDNGSVEMKTMIV